VSSEGFESIEGSESAGIEIGTRDPIKGLYKEVSLRQPVAQAPAQRRPDRQPNQSGSIAREVEVEVEKEVEVDTHFTVEERPAYAAHHQGQILVTSSTAGEGFPS